MSLNIQKKGLIERTEKYIQNYFSDEGSGHDWWHINRVRNMALKLAEKEGGNSFIIEIAALLHDLDDWKLNGEDSNSKSEEWLSQINFPKDEKQKVLDVIEQVSFKGAKVKNMALSLEAQIVQDADRLDAIGAIGIARTFAYGGSKSRLIYDPDVKPVLHETFEAYKKNTAPTINHFYEKLLLLKELMNTNSAKEIAISRHRFMENYLEQFYGEWESEK